MKRATTIIALLLFSSGICLQLYTVNIVHEMAQYQQSNTTYYQTQLDTQQKLITALEDPNQKGGSLVGIYKRELQYGEKPADKQFPSAGSISMQMKISYALIIIAGLVFVVGRERSRLFVGKPIGYRTVSLRIRQAVFVATFMYYCWLMMQVMHELGHVVFTVLPGGEVEKVVLHPFAFSRTDVSVNPRPLLQVWGGPLVGVVLPLAIWGAACLFRPGSLALFRFFAGFCCITNGAYIGFGPNVTGLDTQVMLSLGCARWQLVLFGLVMIGMGLWLLNGTGKVFGIGVEDGEVRNKYTMFSVGLLIAVVAAELCLSAF